jgi:hypothetical protein
MGYTAYLSVNITLRWGAKVGKEGSKLHMPAAACPCYGHRHNWLINVGRYLWWPSFLIKRRIEVLGA